MCLVNSVRLFISFSLVRCIQRSHDLRGNVPAEGVSDQATLVQGMAFNGQGTSLLSVSLDRKFKFLDVRMSCETSSTELNSPLWSCSWDPKNEYRFAVGTHDGQLMVFDSRALGARRPLTSRQLVGQRAVFDLFFADQSLIYRQSNEVGLANISNIRNFQSVFNESSSRVADLDFDSASNLLLTTTRAYEDARGFTVPPYHTVHRINLSEREGTPFTLTKLTRVPVSNGSV
jgi:WD40 repeat protein